MNSSFPHTQTEKSIRLNTSCIYFVCNIAMCLRAGWFASRFGTLLIFFFWNIEKMNVESSGHCCSLLHYRKEQHLKERKEGCLSAAYVLSC